MYNKNFRLSLFFFFLLLPFSVFAAGGGEKKESDDVILVTDARGEEVRIKKGVRRIATFPLPHPHIIISLEKSAAKIVGIHPLAASAARISVLAKLAPELLQAGTGFLQGTKLNVEELLRLNPDVFFTDQYLEGMERIDEIGIPVVYMDLVEGEVVAGDEEITVYSPKETMRNWLDLTAKILEKSDSSGAILADWEKTESAIAEKTQGLVEQPKVLILFKVKEMMVAGRGTFGDYWIASTGGINAAGGVKGNHAAMVKLGSFEEILKWNPDIVYITNFDTTMPEEILANSIPGQDWEHIKAVQTGKVYRIPLGIYRWYPPSLDGALMLKWMASQNHPGLFDWDIQAEIIEHFRRFYNYTLSGEEVQKILYPQASGSF